MARRIASAVGKRVAGPLGGSHDRRSLGSIRGASRGEAAGVVVDAEDLEYRRKNVVRGCAPSDPGDGGRTGQLDDQGYGQELVVQRVPMFEFEVVPELLLAPGEEGQLRDHALALAGGEARERVIADLAALREERFQPGGAARAAARVLEFLER